MLRFFPQIIDGGTGTEIERQGVPMNSVAWSAEAVLTRPDIVLDVHKTFLMAGADLLIANCFSASLHNLEAANLADRFNRINTQAVHIAKEAVKSIGTDCLVAGAISTTTFSGALDYSRLPSGSKAILQYAEQAEIQVQAGAELIILEMMRDIKQTTYALEGALKSNVPVWIGFSCIAGSDGIVYLLDTDIPLQSALNEIPIEMAHAVGIMHTLVEHTPAALNTLKSIWTGRTFAYPHAGYFEMPNWVFQDVITPAEFAKIGQSLLNDGVDAVGGCCGISPQHIDALSSLLS
jgi:methionine synthase I (cobalamin-dependent)